MAISIESIKALRDKTSASIKDVRQALEEAGGDEQKAVAWLRERGAAIAAKRGERATGEGRVECYVHHDGRIAALVEVLCETDFVARTAEFSRFCKDIAMHVAAMRPKYVTLEDVPQNASVSESEKKEVVLLEQPFVKDPKNSVGDLLKTLISQTGENVRIRRFAILAVGESGN
jgi:elongation factor Ts